MFPTRCRKNTEYIPVIHVGEEKTPSLPLLVLMSGQIIKMTESRLTEENKVLICMCTGNQHRYENSKDIKAK